MPGGFSGSAGCLGPLTLRVMNYCTPTHTATSTLHTAYFRSCSLGWGLFSWQSMRVLRVGCTPVPLIHPPRTSTHLYLPSPVPLLITHSPPTHQWPVRPQSRPHRTPHSMRHLRRLVHELSWPLRSHRPRRARLQSTHVPRHVFTSSVQMPVLPQIPNGRCESATVPGQTKTTRARKHHGVHEF